jgi:hypothetical protein
MLHGLDGDAVCEGAADKLVDDEEDSRGAPEEPHPLLKSGEERLRKHRQ